MIHLNNLKLTFGEQIIFDDISWHIKRQERIGLIGDNGAGKTTLFRTIMGQQSPDHGKISVTRGVTLGYLPQSAIEVKGKPLLDEVLSAVAAIKEMEKEIEELQHRLSDTGIDENEYKQRLKRLGTLQHLFEDSGGFQLETEGKKILEGLGFSQNDWNRPVETYSGGWQMRIAMSKLLLQKPSVLLLDEPTNHLDITTMEWLESYLQNYVGTIIIISHDRYFLQRIVTKIVSLERGTLSEFSGSYTFYEQKRQLQEEQLLQQHERQKEEIAHLERFIERFRYKASKAAQVQSRIKQLDKMKRIIPPSANKKIHFYFPTSVRSGRIVTQLENVSQCYDAKTVFQDVDVLIEAGDKIALVGPNGAGKSTFCRIVSGVQVPTSGQVELGYRVKSAFYTQETADQLQGDQSVLDEAMTCNSYIEQTRLRTLLGCFLFTGDDVYKPVSVLSGGEKSRLALAKLLLQESNFLILDEPTNHLDANSKEVLQEALQAYQGTLILVSHDRYFLDKIVNKVIDVEQGQLNLYLGNYSEYVSRKTAMLSMLTPTGETETASNKNINRKSRDDKRLEAEIRQQKFLEKKEFEKKLKPLERRIEQLESRKVEIEAAMAHPDFYANPGQTRQQSQEYKVITAELEQLYQDWEALIN